MRAFQPILRKILPARSSIAKTYECNSLPVSEITAAQGSFSPKNPGPDEEFRRLPLRLTQPEWRLRENLFLASATRVPEVLASFLLLNSQQKQPCTASDTPHKWRTTAIPLPPYTNEEGSARTPGLTDEPKEAHVQFPCPHAIDESNPRKSRRAAKLCGARKPARHADSSFARSHRGSGAGARSGWRPPRFRPSLFAAQKEDLLFVLANGR